VPVLREFYTPFEHTLAQAKQNMRNVKREEIITDITCPKCEQGKLAIKFGRNGEFLACTRYSKEGGPDSCDFTSDFHRDEEGHIVLDAASAPETSDVMCNVCGRPMVIKKGRFGPFLGCSAYPECTNTRRIGKDGKPVPLPEPTGVTCPKCQEGELLKRRGRFGRPFYSCSRYPDCDYSTNDLALVSEYVPDEEEQSSNGAAPPAKAARSPSASNGKQSKSKSVTRSRSTGTGTKRSTTGKAAADEDSKEKTGGTRKRGSKVTSTGKSSGSTSGKRSRKTSDVE
jgi:DNA topoisomerase-1